MRNLGVNIVVALGAAALTSAALMGMNAYRPAATDGAKKDPLMPAVETLQKQLMRRFSQRTNIDFGFNRVSRPGSRQHLGPVMNTIGSRGMNDIKGDSTGFQALDSSGKWRHCDVYRDEMHPENDAERGAIKAVLGSHRDLGIYTFGRFDGSGMPARLKGPAVLNQFAGKPPTTADLSGFASRAWKGGMANYHEVQDGWDLYATRVAADDKTCVDCHHQMSPNSGITMGSPVGLFVIAVQQPAHS